MAENPADIGPDHEPGRTRDDDSLVADPLAIDREAMRRMGYAAVDLLVRRIDELASGPVLRTASRDELEARIDEPAPEGRGDFGDLLARLDRDVLPYVGHFDHPRFFGYIPGSGHVAGGARRPDRDRREHRFRRLARVVRAEPAGADRPRLVPRVDRLSAGVGGRPRVRRIGGEPDGHRLRPGGDRGADVATDRRVRQRSDPLVGRPGRAPSRVPPGPAPGHRDGPPVPDSGRRSRRRDHADAAAGRLPFLVIANAGTTNTGAVDDLPRLARLCRERGVWLHVDGAYGAFAVLTERGRSCARGVSSWPTR